MKHSVVIAGSLAQRPQHGGHTWVFLQYLLGFRQLGWDIHFIDSIEPMLCVDTTGERSLPKDSINVTRFLSVMERFGLGSNYTLQCGDHTWGLPRQQMLERVRSADFFLNVMGFIRDEAILSAAQHRVFLDIDPGFSQMWHALGLSDIFQGHDQFVTIGENIGSSGCSIPTCDISWITSPQPVALSEWPKQTTDSRTMTSIASWRGPFGPIEYQGTTYGLRVHEFRKFAALPTLTDTRCQLALDIHSAESVDLEMLQRNKWELLDPVVCAGDPWRYRDFVQQSGAELMVAKHIYVATRSGWFSDRSICYLASGRPVLAQQTGWKFPSGEGLLGFTNLEEAVEGCREIFADYAVHAKAARDLAVECFDSNVVLTRLLTKLGI